MRRATPTMPRLKKRLRVVSVLLVAVILWYAGTALDARIQPALQELAEYESRAATVETMNTAIAREMEEHPERYEDLYTITYGQDGDMLSVEADSVALNRARAYLIDAATQALQQLPETKLEIPWGSLLDSALLNDRGPSWSLCVQPRGYVDGEIQESVRQIEINKVEYSIDLTLTIAINMILDGDTHLLYVSDTVPVAYLVMDGTTPEYYSQGDA